MLDYNVRDYISSLLTEKLRPFFGQISGPLLEDTVMRTAKLALDDAKKNKNQVSHSKDYEKHTTEVRSHTSAALQKMDRETPFAMVTSMVIVAATEKFVQECLEQPDTVVHSAFLEQVRQYQPLPYIKD